MRFIPILLLFIAILGCESGSAPTKLDSSQKVAITSIKKLGGEFKLDESGKITSITFSGAKATDAGLVHLTSLQELSLTSSKVTDAGLVHLKESTKLRQLYLDASKVTDAGVKELQDALPKCEIHRE